MKLEDKTNVAEGNGDSYNPLAWGILFFTMWLTLVTIHGTGQTTTWIPTALLILSILLMVSIFLKILFNKIFKNDVTTNIFKFASTIVTPIVFEITVAGYIIAWIQGVAILSEPNLTIAIIIGFFWIIIYVIVGVSHINVGWLRFVCWIIFLSISIFITVTSNFAKSWPLWVALLALSLGAIRPKWFNWISLI